MQFIVKLTNYCNLRCVYCSEGETLHPKYIKKTLLKKLIDGVPKLLKFKNEKKVEFLWHGGEPLTYNKQDICDVMDYAIKVLKPIYDVQFLLQTNLTLLDEEWIKIIKKYRVGIGVSLDGYQVLHDANRITSEGKPTFQTVINNIKRLKEAGITPGILMVLNTAQDIDTDRLLNEIKNLKVPCKIHPVIACGRAANRTDIKVISKKYVNLMKEIYIKLFDKPMDIIVDPLDNLLLAILDNTAIKECSFAGNCGQAFMCIFSDGGVGFCGRHADDYNLKYGDLNTNSLIDLYNSSNAKRIRARQKYLIENDCKACKIYNLCHGGCAFEATAFYGIPEAKFPNCEERKQLINFLKTEGLIILKKHLIQEKRRCLALLSEKEALLKELEKREKQ